MAQSQDQLPPCLGQATASITLVVSLRDGGHTHTHTQADAAPLRRGRAENAAENRSVQAALPAGTRPRPALAVGFMGSLSVTGKGNALRARPRRCTGVTAPRSKEMLGASWAMLRRRQLRVLREGGSHAVLYPQTSTPGEGCPQHSPLPPQMGDWLQCRTLGELLCVQHGKGWLCRWDLPVLVGSLLGSAPPQHGGDTWAQRCPIRPGPTLGSVPCSVGVPATGAVRGGERGERGSARALSRGCHEQS